MKRVQRVYLVVRPDGGVRVVKRLRLAWDEIAIAINLTFPPGWGSVTHSLDVEIPGPPVAHEYEAVAP
jgi:hypothetical protein